MASIIQHQDHLSLSAHSNS